MIYPSVVLKLDLPFACTPVYSRYSVSVSIVNSFVVTCVSCRVVSSSSSSPDNVEEGKKNELLSFLGLIEGCDI